MARVKGCEAVYEVADQWRERCLVQDGSLLWPDLEDPTWTVENITDLISAFMDRPDYGSGNFLEKWKAQLDNLLNPVHRVAADTLAIYSLFPANMGKNSKFNNLQEVISWKAQLPPKIKLLERAYERGLGSTGQMYLIARPEQIAYYLRFSQLVKERSVNTSSISEVRLLADEVEGMIRKSSPARHILLHLLFPDDFERTASRDHKLKFVAAFGQDRNLPSDVDDALRQIREELKVQYGRADVDFYQGDIRAIWDSPAQPTEPISQFSARRVWIDKSRRWQSETDPAIHSENSLVYPLQDNAGRDIWKSIRDLTVGDVILHLFDKESFAQRSVVEASPVEVPEDQLGFNGPRLLVRLRNVESLNPELKWEYIKESFGDRLLEIAQASNKALFYLANPELKLRSPEGVTAAPPELINLLNEASRIRLGTELLPSGWPSEGARNDLGQVGFVTRDELETFETLMRSKRQVILEGPPGSGKTFIADRFARYFTGNPLAGEHDDRIEFVQFHQSYGYEDFVQGIRPVTEGGTLTYRVVPGIFLEMCERAEADPTDKPYVLIIDEINRGNLSRIFGELLMALEYREKKVRLANPWVDSIGSSRTHLTIPENLYLIGTMNSTDRSLAMIDYALRRRFYFYPLRPVINGKAPVLERWLASSSIAEDDQTQLLRYFISINQRISDHLTADFQVGHSYFMNERVATASGMQQVWDFALKPLLQEYFHSVRGGSDFIDEFDPARFGAAVEPAVLDFDEDQSDV